MTRLVPVSGGDVSAEMLETYRRAGEPAYREFERAAAPRADAVTRRAGLSAVSRRQAGQVLCAWNAYVLQTLGEALLAVGRTAAAGGRGLVPPPIAGPVLACFGQVGPWMDRARRAAAEPGYRVEEELDLPADLPLPERAEPWSSPGLRAMAVAARQIGTHAEVAVAEVAADDGRDVSRLTGWLATASTAMEHAGRLLDAGPDQAVHRVIEDQLRRALETYYRLGQLAVMRALPDGRLDRILGAGGPLDLEEIDVWYLTDPRSRGRWRVDPRARRSVAALWEADPDPGATVRIQTEIDVALRAGYLGYATGPSDQQLGHYFRSPWPAVYEVRRRVVIGGVPLRPMQQFTFEVSAGEPAEPGSFTRRIRAGTFIPADEADYCDPPVATATITALRTRGQVGDSSDPKLTG
jgi:hypothetical protein